MRPNAQVFIHITSEFLGVELKYQQVLKFSRWSQCTAKFEKGKNCEEINILSWRTLNTIVWPTNQKHEIKTKETKANFWVFSILACCYIEQHSVLKQIIQLKDCCVNSIKWLISSLQMKKTKEAHDVLVIFSGFSLLGCWAQKTP